MLQHKVLTRLGQFWRGLRATVTLEEMQVAATLLPSAAFERFARLPVDARRHSLNVLRDLQRAGQTHPDLLAAALLHDVGKLAADEAGVSINLWLRGPLVLLDAIAPKLSRSLSSDSASNGWRYALYVHYDHPQIGADWATQDGCSELTCWLIRQHQQKLSSESDEKSELLRFLQWADERN